MIFDDFRLKVCDELWPPLLGWFKNSSVVFSSTDIKVLLILGAP